MRHFDYKELASRAWQSGLVGVSNRIAEYKGQQALYLKQKPAVLEKLADVAKIQSVDASNRIEGIVTTHARLEKLALDKTTPINRSEREIAGYRKVLGLIHDSHESIPLSSNVILHLHRDLFFQVPEADGRRYKSTVNVIEETWPHGSRLERFRPLPPYETEGAIKAACASFNEWPQVEPCRRCC